MRNLLILLTLTPWLLSRDLGRVVLTALGDFARDVVRRAQIRRQTRKETEAYLAREEAHRTDFHEWGTDKVQPRKSWAASLWDGLRD